MGVKNFLKFLQPVSSARDLKKYSGQRVAVDTLCWLHRGAIGCAVDLFYGKPTQEYLKFIGNMVKRCLEYHIEPVFVIDGQDNPMKKEEDANRKKLRMIARQKAQELVDQGKTKSKEFRTYCVEAIEITEGMISATIAFARAISISVIVAPYEADPQVSYLIRMGYCDAGMTEDSDLLVYGGPNLMYKLDTVSKAQTFDFVSLSDLIAKKYRVKPDFPGRLEPLDDFNLHKVASMGCLAGCDYTNHLKIKGLGITTAFNLIQKYGSAEETINNIFKSHKWSASMPKNYDQQTLANKYRTAERFFSVHRVFDVSTEYCVPVESSFRTLPYYYDSTVDKQGLGDLGENFKKMCRGDLDPNTLVPRNFPKLDKETQELVETILPMFHETIESNKFAFSQYFTGSSHDIAVSDVKKHLDTYIANVRAGKCVHPPIDDNIVDTHQKHKRDGDDVTCDAPKKHKHQHSSETPQVHDGKSHKKSKHHKIELSSSSDSDQSSDSQDKSKSKDANSSRNYTTSTCTQSKRVPTTVCSATPSPEKRKTKKTHDSTDFKLKSTV